jgi:hypothetical protein
VPEKPADSEAAKWSEADGNDSNELRHRQAGHISPWISPARPTWEFGIATNNWCLGPASMVSRENLKSHDSYGVFATSRFGQQAPAKQKEHFGMLVSLLVPAKHDSLRA